LSLFFYVISLFPLLFHKLK